MPDITVSAAQFCNELRPASPASSAHGDAHDDADVDVDALWDTCIDHIITAAGYVDRLADRYEGKGISPDIRRLADQLHLVARTAYGVAAHA